MVALVATLGCSLPWACSATADSNAPARATATITKLARRAKRCMFADVWGEAWRKGVLRDCKGVQKVYAISVQRYESKRAFGSGVKEKLE